MSRPEEGAQDPSAPGASADEDAPSQSIYAAGSAASGAEPEASGAPSDLTADASAGEAPSATGSGSELAANASGSEAAPSQTPSSDSVSALASASGARSTKAALLAEFERRTGLLTWIKSVRATPVAGVPRWLRLSGFALAGVILLQLVTGVGLAAYYSPGTTSAWGSVVHLEEQVVAGRFLRGLHAFGASAVVICLLLHLLLKAWRLEFVRTLGWWLGLALVPIVSVFSLTGYLLPWDQRGYWATQVASGIMGATPLVGESASRVFLGGSDLGTLTLTRFFTLHAVVLPLCLVALGAFAFRVWRRESTLEASGAERVEGYWPRHATRDLCVVALVAVVVAALAFGVGPHLEAPADPESDFPPRPEWYFAPLRELLKTLPEPWGSLVLPGLVFAFYALALPLLARRLSSPTQPALEEGELAKAAPGLRALKLAAVLPAIFWLGLLGLTTLEDMKDKRYQQARERAKRDATLARELAREGIPPEGPGEMLRLHPPRHGRQLFVDHCQRCHAAEGMGGREGPNLTGYLSLSWLARVVEDPRHPDFFGGTKIDDMPPLPPEAKGDLPALATYLRSLDPSVKGLDAALTQAGRAAFLKHGCNDCHPTDPFVPGSEGDLGPSLHNYGSEEWLLEFLKDPGSPRFYSEANEMPAYGKELSEQELKALVVYLRSLDEPK